MTENENTTEAVVEYEKGSWQESLHKSTSLLVRAGNAKKTASSLLWKGAKAAVEAWLPNAGDDKFGEGLYAEVLAALGDGRKGDASKIKTVAVAVEKHSLDLTTFPNLSQAYAEANRLLKIVKQQAIEDSAADDAVAEIEVPKTASTAESAAKILLGKGVDGAVVAILDALNGATPDVNNEAAHKAFLRAVSTEISSRIKAKADAEAAEKKAKADAAKAAAPKAGATKAKAKPAAPKAAATKGKPKGKPAAKPVAVVEDEVAPEEEADDLEGTEAGDMFDEVDDDTTEATEAPAPTPAKRRPVRRPVRK